MTKQQKLKFQNDHDETVIFQHPVENEYVAIGGAGKDDDGYYRRSRWCNSAENCMQYLGYQDGYSPEELEEKLKSWKYIGSISPQHNPVPVNTKVRILENAKEECDKVGIGWNTSMKKMIGKVYEIGHMRHSDYYINDYVFPRSAFVIAEGEEEVSEDKTEEAIQMLKDKGYKIIKG